MHLAARPVAPVGWDAAFAAALGLATLALTLVVADGATGWMPVGGSLVVAAAAVLAWRRRAPGPVLAVVTAAVACFYWLDNPDGPAVVLVAVAMYTVASRLSWPRAALAGAALVAVWVGTEQFLETSPGEVAGTDHYIWIIVVASVGVAVGAARRARTESLARQEEQTLRRVEQERLRIARDVHDVVSHSLSLIAVQAGVGAHVAVKRPEEAVAALLQIKAASGQALAELRTTLKLLRDPDEVTGELPGLEHLPEVAQTAELAGFSVSVDGHAGSLPPDVDHAAFRIVREAMTNSVRHARDAGSITVRLERANGTLHLRVQDDGRDPGTITPGQGLRGVRESVELLGGRLETGFSGRGFALEAELPVGRTGG